MTNAPVPTPPTTPMPSAPPQGRVRPSGWWYVLVPIIFFAGVGFAIAGAISWGIDIAESYELVGADGKASIQLDAGDDGTVFAVWDDGRSTDNITRPPATVTVTGPDGEDVAFNRDDGGSSTFTVNDQSGIDVGSFTAPTTGSYDVEIAFDPTTSGTPPQAALGEFSFAGLGERIVRPIGIGFAASLALFVALLLLRGAAKRRMRSSPQFQGPTPVTGGTNPSNGPFV